MPHTTQEQERATAVYAQLLQAGVQCTLNLETLEITPLTATSPQPAATKPKAKTTPTKRKAAESPAQKKFRAEVLDANYDKRQANNVWKATKPDYMFGVSYDKAQRKGWAKKDGTISKKGMKMTNLTARQVAALYPRRRL